ncbi:MAG: hypothetical protein R3B68_04480 [Phycisphaerales bacterium]
MDDNDNHVDPIFACPTCGERDADRLAWIDDDQVECQACGTIYEPGAAKGGGDAQP